VLETQVCDIIKYALLLNLLLYKINNRYSLFSVESRHKTRVYYLLCYPAL